MNGGVERRSATGADLVRVDQLLELGGGGSSRLQVASRDGDLDLGR